MIFERNQIIPENYDEEEILANSGKRNKKVRLYGVYIYTILTQESSEHNTFTCKQMVQRIVDRFKTKIDISTVQYYMNELKAYDDDIYTLNGDAYHGYYLELK